VANIGFSTIFAGVKKRIKRPYAEVVFE